MNSDHPSSPSGAPFPAPRDTPTDAFAEASSGLRDKLAPERIAELRRQVETTNRSFKHIGAAIGVSPATVCRYARQQGWRRPSHASGAARAARRDRVAEKLWRLTERHAEALEDQPIELAQRSLQPLVRLTRMLGDIDKHATPRTPADAFPIDEPKPRRSLHELRDELAAHLERIQREEGYGWEVREWWFESGGGI